MPWPGTREVILSYGEIILNQDIDISSGNAAEGIAEKEVEKSQEKIDYAQIASGILKRLPSTLEDIHELRAAIFHDPETWEKFQDFVTSVLDESEPDFELKYAIGLAVLGSYEKAEEELKKFEKFPIVGCLLARICMETGRRKEAINILKKVHQRVPEVSGYHFLLCEALESGEDLDGFKKELEKLEKALPDHPQTIYFKARVLERDGEYEAAKRLYLDVIDKDPEHSGALFRLAFRADIELDEDRAIDLYSRSLRGGIPNLAALMNLGVLYEDDEEYDMAVHCFERAVHYYPMNKKAARYLRDARASVEMYYDEEKERKEDKQSQILMIPVSDFELSVRSRNCLTKMNITTLGDLIKRTEAELLAFKNFGETSLMEIKEILASKGLRLGLVMPESNELPELPQSGATEGTGDDLLLQPVDELDLSVRSRHCLDTLGIQTVGQLVDTSEQVLLTMKNFGQTSLNEIRKKLADHGLSIKV